MIVYSKPQFAVITCERCGTVFQPEASDTLLYNFKTIDTFKVLVACPTCAVHCPVTTIGTITEGGEYDVE